MPADKLRELLVVKIRDGVDPEPTLGRDPGADGLELLRHKAVQQRCIEQKTAALPAEEVLADGPTSLAVGLHANEDRALVGGWNLALRQRPGE